MEKRAQTKEKKDSQIILKKDALSGIDPQRKRVVRSAISLKGSGRPNREQKVKISKGKTDEKQEG